ncbi:efflux RND transporter periplasmic adaptor subunit [Calothrix sp. UHCC 0171]|uniref:efflux RND transporter periplasmic adaptor subunit n=1 Tax=Calothrix sp. UHCC 0171 TaxID=3110245 RepID=UPI002B220030|nr:efflux RND transporter periplasmic adaptor subunit [Calothrix sp. UHCC 0171]MEA5571747.1 efflux RND transporter periplasmic adaptor subunit [Calothrix sp. UHCC 0171]
MSDSEFPDYSLPGEAEKPAVNDSHQAEPEQPQIKPGRISMAVKKQRWSLIIGSILLIVGLGGGWRWRQMNPANNAGSRAAANQPMGVPVKLATVETGNLQETSQFVGSLEAPRSVVLKPDIDGRVTEVVVKEGDRVQGGQVIIRLQSDDAQAQVQQAKAALERTQTRLAELKAGTRKEEIAQARAKLNQAQIRLSNAQAGARPEEIAQAESQIEAAKSDLELAQSRAKRYAQLRKEGAVSQDQLEGYLREERSAQARLQEAQRRLEEVRKSRRSDINELAAVVEQEKQNLRQLENGPRQEEIAQARSQVSEAAAQVRTAQVQLQYTNILAPFTGVVGNIPVKLGEFVNKGDELTTITKNDSLELNLAIPISQGDKLRVGLPVQLLDAQGQPTARGKVTFTSPDASVNSQTILAKATFANTGGQLLNRQLVSARVIWNERPGILIPVTAVSRLGGETFVFVAQAPEQPKPGMPALVAVQKPVKLGAIEGNNYQVSEGLKAGEKIVVSGILNLNNGVPIIAESEEGSNRKN